MATALAAAMLLGAATSAHAAAPAVVTITGTVGSSTQSADDVSDDVAYDISKWLDKPFTLVMQPDITGVVKKTERYTELPGVDFGYWAPVKMRYSLTVDGAALFSGTDSLFSEVGTANDVLVPQGIEVSEVSIGIIADGTRTYDLLEMRFSGLDLGCVTPGPNETCSVYEYGTVYFSYAWDMGMGNGQGLKDGDFPDLLATSFADGLAGAGFVIGRAVASAGEDIGIAQVYLPLQVTGVAVTAVPEPATVAMLLAGLASLGALRARRRS